MGKGYLSSKKTKLPVIGNSSEFRFTFQRQRELEENRLTGFEDSADALFAGEPIKTCPVIPTVELPKDFGENKNFAKSNLHLNDSPLDFFPSDSDNDEPCLTKGDKPQDYKSRKNSWFSNARKVRKRNDEHKSLISEKKSAEHSNKKQMRNAEDESSPFVTAFEKLADENPSLSSNRTVRSGFVPPVRATKSNQKMPSKTGADLQFSGFGSAMAGAVNGKEQNTDDIWKKCLEGIGLDPSAGIPEPLRNLEPRLVEHVANEIMLKNTGVSWEDIAGLEHAKRCVMELVIWPLKRPDLFQGTRAPGKGLLLYGPPGTGKTLIGKAIAGESKATFFSISASSLTSKWIGEGEKLVRSLFGLAACLQPAVIFIDEIDSLLSQRKEDGEHESSRRLKTQFLVEMEGCSGGNEQVLLIGATNRPQELDPAVRRRMSNRLYIPLPEAVARARMVETMLKKDGLLTLTEEDIKIIASETEGYSGSDMKCVVKEASMAPLREAMATGLIANISKDEIRPLKLQDFQKAILSVRPSVAPEELTVYKEWSKQFGGGVA